MVVTDIEIVKSSFDAYQRADAAGGAKLLSSAFVFTSPQDDHISKTTYMERCFPTADRFARSRILEMVSTAHGVVTVYEYELVTGGTYRNAELTRVEDRLIVETQVFFGGQVPA
jgi:ketosteroid isomerase-like protein